MTQNKCITLLSRLLCYAAVLALLTLALKYLLPWLSPFLLAFLTAAVIEPVVRRLSERFGMKRSFASAACSVAGLTAVCTLTIFLAGRAVYELTGLVRDLPTLLSKLPDVISSVEDWIDRFVVSAPPEVRAYMEGVLDSLAESASRLPGALTEKLLALASSAASAAPKTLLFLVTYVIGVFFISGSYGDIKAFLLRQIPHRHRDSARDMKSGLTDTMIKWLKAQVMLMCLTFLELTVAFLLLRIDYAAFLALFVSIVDALPVFGVGTVLIPWAVVELIAGNEPRAAALAVIFAVVTVSRNFMQPRLVGGMLGVHPVPMLIAMYVGFRCAGILGMVLFPIALVMLGQLSEMGYVKLWK